MQTLTLQPISRIDGEITLPGSKSISNRALLLAALAQGKTSIDNLLFSDDTKYMLKALSLLGVDCHPDTDKKRCEVQGLGGPFRATDVELYLGNAGTAMRPLCAALCLGEGKYILTGEKRMSERPIASLVDALVQAGANIRYLKKKGFPPLAIQANGLMGGPLVLDGSISSQFLTAILMATPMATEDSTISIAGALVSKPYIDITLKMMSRFNAIVHNNSYTQFLVPGGQRYQSPQSFFVEGDASSASYFLAAAAIKGGRVRVHGVGSHSMQGDIMFAGVLEKMGAKITWGENFIEAERGALRGVDLDLNHIPDAAMTLATTALFAQGPTTIRNIHNWRVKETDRLAAMACELTKVGAKVIEGEDYLTLYPPDTIQSACIDTYNDHRMAMSFSLAALGENPITINDPGCTAKTFPSYFSELSRLCHRA
ncbi:unnamed protein product [Cyprideis torosa]|uniref:3-phosphoshikimate 1-carboxyvinyltransferase n=1 Tax=Cyprideis torosa TaxID=163714 RepID=A0A7R8ZXB3_9CRUS|nr:unnamed protein product [Cyprideis torosa]CAG0906820.1 unnamed protein product [Cyprideis torosa]